MQPRLFSIILSPLFYWCSEKQQIQSKAKRGLTLSLWTVICSVYEYLQMVSELVVAWLILFLTVDFLSINGIDQTNCQVSSNKRLATLKDY